MLYLIRHAATLQEPERPVEQWDLDPAGAADLDRLATAVDWPKVRFFSSPEPKAISTAARLTARPVEQVAGLAEVRRGGWEADYAARVAEFFARPAQPCGPGWETADEALARFDAAITETLDRTEGDVAVVSHGLVLSVWLSRLADPAAPSTTEPSRSADPDAAGPSEMDLWRSLRFPDLFVLDRAEIGHASRPRRAVVRRPTW